MNRLDNLRMSLGSWINSHQMISEIVVVDWSSDTPIHEDSTISNMDIKIVRVDGEDHFSLARSYNLAFDQSNPRNKILLKLDADYMLKDSRWLDRIADQIEGREGISNNGRLSDYFVTGSHMFSANLTGFILLNKENFVGYNENMEGYGHDDIEMYARIKKSFPKLVEIPFFNIKDYILHIPHSDEERVRNYKNKNMVETSLRNMHVSAEFARSKYKETHRKGNLTRLIRI